MAAAPEQGGAFQMPPAGCNRARCLQNRRYLEHHIQALDIERQALTARNAELSQRVTASENKALKLERRLDGPKRHIVTWQEMLRRHMGLDPNLGNPDFRNLEIRGTYEKIWQLSQQEENMSASVKLVHPSIKLKAGAVEEDIPAEGGTDDKGDGELGEEEDGSEQVEEAAAPEVETGEEALRSLVLPRQYPRPVAICGFIEWRAFPFEALPTDLQARIFRLLLCHGDKLIHAFSRLDKWVPPTTAPPSNDHKARSHLPHRFYIGITGDEVSLTDDTLDPNEVLAPLLVCRRWYFLGVHCFYGLNTFAFSSLGEFGRFMTGIVSRADRVQYIELTWTGNQRLTFQGRDATLEERKEFHVKRFKRSRRTKVLDWLVELPRLRGLVVHINESGRRYMRRKQEPPGTQRLYGQAMRSQANHRKFRALRTVQGLDAILQLRGMRYVKWYDLCLAIEEGRQRQPVRDVDFTRNISEQTTRPKTISARVMAELENLDGLFPIIQDGPGYLPSAEDWAIVHSFYEDDDDWSDGAATAVDSDSDSTAGSALEDDGGIGRLRLHEAHDVPRGIDGGVNDYPSFDVDDSVEEFEDDDTEEDEANDKTGRAVVEISDSEDETLSDVESAARDTGPAHSGNRSSGSHWRGYHKRFIDMQDSPLFVSQRPSTVQGRGITPTPTPTRSPSEACERGSGSRDHPYDAYIDLTEADDDDTSSGGGGDANEGDSGGSRVASPTASTKRSASQGSRDMPPPKRPRATPPSPQ